MSGASPGLQAGERAIAAIDNANGEGAGQVNIKQSINVIDRGRTGKQINALPQVRVTVKGLEYLHRRLGGTQPLSFGTEGPRELLSGSNVVQLFSDAQ